MSVIVCTDFSDRGAVRSSGGGRALCCKGLDPPSTITKHLSTYRRACWVIWIEPVTAETYRCLNFNMLAKNSFTCLHFKYLNGYALKLKVTDTNPPITTVRVLRYHSYIYLITRWHGVECKRVNVTLAQASFPWMGDACFKLLLLHFAGVSFTWWLRGAPTCHCGAVIMVTPSTWILILGD